MRINILASTIIISLLTIANAQAESGGMGGMHLSKGKGVTIDTTAHHKFRGSSLHENAANAHALAAAQHKKAAEMYRKNADESAEQHADAAISFSIDAMGATAATKSILHETK